MNTTTPGLKTLSTIGILIGDGQHVNLERGDLAATGSIQGDAAAITKKFTNATAADGAKGVILPANPGTSGSRLLVVYNSVAANGLKVYPPTSGTINGGSANAPVTIEGLTTAIFMSSDATNWAAMYTANA